MTKPEKTSASTGLDLSAARQYLQENGIVIGPDDPRSTIEVAECHRRDVIAAQSLGSLATKTSEAGTPEVPAYIADPSMGGLRSIRPASSRRMNMF